MRKTLFLLAALLASFSTGFGKKFPYAESILSKRVQAIEEKNAELSRENQELKAQIEDIIRQQPRTKKALDYTVSFTAYAEATKTYNENDPVIFTGVLANYGDFYDGTTGEFRCPEKAYYSFSLSIYTSGGNAGVEILVDGVPVASVYNGESFSQSSTSVVYLCDVQNIVSLRAVYTDSEIWGGDLYLSSFTGTLLFSELN